MPRFNIYIREADIGLWDSIENKSDFIHKALNGTPLKKLEEPIGTPRKIFQDLKEAKVCKKGHFYTGDKCMQKGC